MTLLFSLAVLVNIPHRTPAFLPWFFPSSLLWRIDTTQPVLYLTFDDGPVPGPTEFVLDTLKKYSALATFFCIGDNIRKHKNVFEKIVQEGHAVGNHTYNHLNGWKTQKPEYLLNIKQCDESLGIVTARSRLFRPPYGRITRGQISELSSYKIVMWDVLSVDYNKNLHHEQCLKNTVKATRNGSIIVFHDSLKAEKNMAYALPRFLDHFSNRGFTFKSLEDI